MMSDALIVAAGSLSKPEFFAPQMRVYAIAAAPVWCAPADGQPRFAGMSRTVWAENTAAGAANVAGIRAAAVSKTAPKKGDK